MAGTIRTLWLFALLTALMVGIGQLVALAMGTDPIGATIVFLVIAAAFNFISYFWGDKIVLRAYRAKVVTRDEAPRLYGIVERLAMTANVPTPTVAVIPTHNPNAFATGRGPKHATVAATAGILNMLDDEELEGVMAHEMAHVLNRDMLVMTSAATIAGAISFAVQMFFYSSLFGGNREGGGNLLVALFLMITAPVAAMLVQLAISRTREFKADAGGAKLTGKPWALARALQKIEAGNQAIPMESGNPAHASLFISNPFRGGGMAGLFQTHPSMEERIRRLERM